LAALPPPAFISYSSDDAAFARKLAGDLKTAFAPVWLDQADIPPAAHVPGWIWIAGGWSGDPGDHRQNE
jgi:hypothetical protein